LGTQQVVACTYGTTPPCLKATYNITDIVGSYFAMDTNSNGIQANEKTPIGSLNGIVLGTIQPASGSHTGAINGSESPDIDNPWTFFGGTGMHQTTAAVTVLTDAGASKTLDMSGWNVTWNGIASIPLTQTGSATITCDTAACNNNENYFSMRPSTSAGWVHVAYLHLVGTVSVPGAVPLANPDSATTIAGNPVTVDVLDNDTSATPITAGSVAIVAPGPANGTAVVDNAADTDTVTYTPNTAGTPFLGADAFVYTVANAFGNSNAATVSIDVQTNVAPVAVNDSAPTNPVELDNAGGNLVIQVLANDTDANNAPGLPGGINTTTVTVLSQPAVGSCTANANGTITYSQTPPSASGQFSCTYQVSDSDTFNPPGLPSNVATVCRCHGHRLRLASGAGP
jgi:hypothetical protein